MTKIVYCTAVVLQDEAGRTLLAKRPEGKAMAGLWEFPGGKIEAGELPEHALSRELSEELAITVNPADLVPLQFVSHKYADFHLLMLVYRCTRWQGVPTPQEQQQLVWVAQSDLMPYSHQTPAADVPVFETLIAEQKTLKKVG